MHRPICTGVTQHHVVKEKNLSNSQWSIFNFSTQSSNIMITYHISTIISWLNIISWANLNNLWASRLSHIIRVCVYTLYVVLVFTNWCVSNYHMCVICIKCFLSPIVVVFVEWSLIMLFILL